RLLLTVAGCWGGAVLISRLMTLWSYGSRSGPLGAFTLLHFLLLLISPTLFDRYFIVLFPGALALAASGTNGMARGCTAGLVILAAMGLVSFGLAHDWLSWNGARWAVGQRALDRGIPARDIEGGFEWDSWYALGDVAPPAIGTPPQGLMLPF